MVIAHLTLAGENGQSAQRLQAPATTTLTVFSTATFGAFPLHIQQLCLHLPVTKRNVISDIMPKFRGFTDTIKTKCFKQRLERGAAGMDSLRKLMCYQNIRACESF